MPGRHANPELQPLSPAMSQDAPLHGRHRNDRPVDSVVFGSVYDQMIHEQSQPKHRADQTTDTQPGDPIYQQLSREYDTGAGQLASEVTAEEVVEVPALIYEQMKAEQAKNQPSKELTVVAKRMGTMVLYGADRNMPQPDKAADEELIEVEVSKPTVIEAGSPPPPEEELIAPPPAPHEEAGAPKEDAPTGDAQGTSKEETKEGADSPSDATDEEEAPEAPESDQVEEGPKSERIRAAEAIEAERPDTTASFGDKMNYVIKLLQYKSSTELSSEDRELLNYLSGNLRVKIAMRDDGLGKRRRTIYYESKTDNSEVNLSRSLRIIGAAKTLATTYPDRAADAAKSAGIRAQASHNPINERVRIGSDARQTLQYAPGYNEYGMGPYDDLVPTTVRKAIQKIATRRAAKNGSNETPKQSRDTDENQPSRARKAAQGAAGVVRSGSRKVSRALDRTAGAYGRAATRYRANKHGGKNASLEDIVQSDRKVRD